MPHLSEEQFKTYLKKIGFKGEPQLDLATLKQIQKRHLLTFPFGVLDVHIKSRNPNVAPIPIDLNSIYAKLVTNSREGYCFEHNELLAAVLNKIGFTNIKKYVGGVLMGRKDKPVPNHEVLIVTLDQAQYLVDTGFAPRGSIIPLPLEVDTNFKSPNYNRKFRIIVDQDEDYILQSKSSGDWLSLYFFNTNILADEVHLREANKRVSVSMESPFVSRLFITQNTKKGQKILSSTRFSEKEGDQETSEVIRNPKQFLTALQLHFDINLPDSTRFDAKKVKFEYYLPLQQARMLKRLESTLSQQELSDSTVVGKYHLRKR